jgi:hypothetical protein
MNAFGGRILRAEPCSEDGQYVFPAGLAPLMVSGGEGDYWEPNVWMQHDAADGS